MRTITKFFIAIPALIMMLHSSSFGQDFLPVVNDNYMGINQATLQPAAIVDSRFKLDINLFGVNADIYNNMIRFNSGTIWNPFGMVSNEDWWEENTALGSANGKEKSAFASQTLLGPGFMMTLTPKHAIGFTSRVRNIMNLDDISEPLARSIYDDFKSPEYWDTWYRDEDMRAVNHVFADYGLTYAMEVFNKEAHYMKTGMTVKLLQGLGGAYLQADEFEYYFYKQDENGEDADYMSWNAPYVSSGVSKNWNWGSGENDDYPIGFTYAFISKPSVGLDLGLVYEFRPKYKDYLYDMDGETGLERRDLNKYLLKIGISVLDIGRLRYTKDYNSQDFRAQFTDPSQVGGGGFPDETHWMDIEEVKFGMPPYVNFSDTVYRRAQLDQGISATGENEDKFIIKLPTAISLQADVNIVKGLYVNLTTFTGLRQSFDKVGNSHYMSLYSLTPRYEHKWFAVMLPLSYNQFQKLNVGLGLRAAFLYMGVNNLFSGFFSDPYGTSFYFGIKIPIWYGKPPADRDGDAVSDAKDKCPTTPGIWAFMGCPDRDGDGVQDSEDLCPDIPGPVEFKGCPDRDGDGVPDMDDQCPDQPGPRVTGGCPDRDGDGVMDIQDECPDVRGIAQLNGCPDRDGDGVADQKDLCPDVAGKVEFGGCPFLDTDNDGIKDEDDMCPTTPGPPENNGCPYTDTDGDGVIDKEDRCPLTPGDPSNFGCPVIKEEEQAVLRTAFENLEFETGKAVIRSSSFASLNELAELLISKPAWKLKISGHTDNVGNDDANMTLSKNRAQATASYLKGKGVAENQLITEWFGESMPIADNSTAEGRQKNRRVEMQVVFD